MKVLILSHQRCGSTTLCKWLSKELNINLDGNHYNSETFNLVFFNNDIIKKNEVEDYYPTKEDISKFNKVIYLTRDDSINTAISCITAKNTNNYHDEYEITKEWIYENKNQILEESNRYDKMKYKIKTYNGFQITYENMYINKTDVNRVISYLNIENPKHLDMIDYDKKYRKDTHNLTHDFKRKNII